MQHAWKSSRTTAFAGEPPPDEIEPLAADHAERYTFTRCSRSCVAAKGLAIAERRSHLQKMNLIFEFTPPTLMYCTRLQCQDKVRITV
jgi:hypothetical protein